MIWIILIIVWFIIGFVSGMIGFVIVGKEDITITSLLYCILFGVCGVISTFLILKFYLDDNSDIIVIKRETILKLFKKDKN